MAIENAVSSFFDPRSSNVKCVFDCHLSSLILVDAPNGICDNPRCQIIPGAKSLILMVIKY